MWKSSARPVFKGLALASGLAIPAVLVASSGGLGQAHAKEREFQNEVAFPAAPWGQYLKEVTGIGAVRAADLDMLQAQVVFRHGARSPFSDSPEKPGLWHEKLRTNLGDLPPAGMKHLTTKEDVDAKGLRNSTFDSENLKGGLEKGTLTDAGVRQARALGGVLGERYRAAGILGAPLAEGEVVLRSSFTKRTIETLQGVMSGIFPADALARKPIVVHVGSNGQGTGHTDYLHHHPECCARYKFLLGRGVKGWNGTRMPAPSQNLVDRMKALGMGFEEHHIKLYGILAWRDMLTCQLGSGLAFVPAVSDALVEEIDRHSAAQAVSWFSGGLSNKDRAETLRLAHGRTLGEMLDRLSHAAATPNAPKLVLYSAHDWTIMPLVMMMLPDDFPVPWPRFCSDLKVELFRKRGSGEHFVRVEYSPGTHGEGLPGGKPQVLRLAACDGAEHCELGRFVKALQPWVPTDFDHECKMKPGDVPAASK